MGFVALVAITFASLVVIFFLLALLRRPIYRITSDNVIRLIEETLDGSATEQDWDVFLEVPIRYDDDLERIRCQAADIFLSYSTGVKLGFLLSEDGLTQLGIVQRNLRWLSEK